MGEGEELTCRSSYGGKITVIIDERVYPDRSCGQYEAGWWVFTENSDYFLSESGILYESSGGGAYTQPCGIEPGLARRIKEMEVL